MKQTEAPSELLDESFIDWSEGKSKSVAQAAKYKRNSQTGRKRKMRSLTVLHLCCIALFSMFLCWGVKGHVPLNGDDMRVLHRIMLKRVNLQYDYIAWTRSRMHTAALLYEEYKLAGDSIERANLIWLGVYLVSAFAAYAYLRKVFSPTVALLGSIIYLCYSSKFEPLTWWSAGAYTLIWLAFFGIMAAFESKLSFRTKSVVISTIVFFSMYIYEVFTCVIPVLSLVMLLRRKRQVKQLKRSDWCFALLPTAVVLIHIATLASARNPIFLFESSTIGKASFEQRLLSGFSTALDATVGPKHLADVRNASHAFKDHYRKDDPALPALLWSGVIVFILSVLGGIKQTLKSAPNMVSVGETALIGSVALFISAFIGFVSNFLVTPSRLTGIPSIGLMLLVCAGVELLLFTVRRSVGLKRFVFSIVTLAAVTTVFAYTIREAQAFCSMLRQAGEVNEVDVKIASQIKAMHPHVKEGEEIFVRIPRAKNELTGRWRNFWSGFNSGRANETLWYLYDLDPGFISFTSTRYQAACEDELMQPIVANWKKIGIENVYPFFVDEDQTAHPIRSLTLTDKAGKVLRKIDFSSHFSSNDLRTAVDQTMPLPDFPEGQR